MTEREELLRRLERVKALAERGVGGEKENAEALLNRLMAKYGISEEDIEDTAERDYFIRYHNFWERKLIVQIAYKHLGNGHCCGTVGGVLEMSKHCFLRRHPGEGTPMILAIVLVLLMLFCMVAEFSRVWIIAQGVKEAAQQAVISTINDNYDDVYHAVREGYAAGWYPDGTGRWDESVDTGDVYGQLASTLGLENTGSGYQKISNGNVEYTISGLSVELSNNALSSGQSKGYTAAVEIRLEVPVRFLGNLLPASEMMLHTEAKYVPVF